MATLWLSSWYHGVSLGSQSDSLRTSSTALPLSKYGHFWLPKCPWWLTQLQDYSPQTNGCHYWWVCTCSNTTLFEPNRLNSILTRAEYLWSVWSLLIQRQVTVERCDWPSVQQLFWSTEWLKSLRVAAPKNNCTVCVYFLFAFSIICYLCLTVGFAAWRRTDASSQCSACAADQ